MRVNYQFFKWPKRLDRRSAGKAYALEVDEKGKERRTEIKPGYMIISAAEYAALVRLIDSLDAYQKPASLALAKIQARL